MSYVIFTDTSANLPTPMTREKDLRVIPFSYYIEGKEQVCLDTEVFDGGAFYAMMPDRVKIQTSQISPDAYRSCLEEPLQEGRDVLYIGMSSGISGSLSCAMVAARQLKEEYPEQQIRVVDTLGASLGEGLAVLKAVEYRDAGLALEDAVPRLEDFCERMYQTFIVDDLYTLKLYGRLSNAATIVGTMLQIKPLLKGNEKGQIVANGKQAGRRRAIRELARRYRELVRDASEQTVGIAHADCKEDADYLASLLREIAEPKEILTVMYEPVTGSHVGSGTLALFFQGENGVRSR